LNESTLTPERILETTEEVLRRFGPTKATVVDVARVLGVSHGSVYRHFPSKAALREAVAARWLERVATPLELIVNQNISSVVRLREWVEALSVTKRRHAKEDPELFATYLELVHESRDVVMQHVEHLVEQLARIVADGMQNGELHVKDANATARAILDATGKFHNPVHVKEWADPNLDVAFERVWGLLLPGLVTPQK
jgi:AcrR family transcriptional regulator